jgi:hypothetical protein
MFIGNRHAKNEEKQEQDIPIEEQVEVVDESNIDPVSSHFESIVYRLLAHPILLIWIQSTISWNG